MFKRRETEAVSPERAVYLAKKRGRKRLIFWIQIAAIALLVLLWEGLAQMGIIDSFIMSQPSRMVRTFINLLRTDLMLHLAVTCAETLAGFLLGTALGVGLAILLWWSDLLSKICEPFLVILNALPKIALGPVFIVWVGAGVQAIIVMALAISLIVTVMEMLNGFSGTDPDLLRMAKTFGADRKQLFCKIVLPNNLGTLFHAMKVNIGLSLVGVIAGEFLVSKAGLGYLIVYGGQVFQLDLVMTSVVILAVVAAVLYHSVVLAEMMAEKRSRHR